MGPLDYCCSPSGFSTLYSSAFLGVSSLGKRPLPKSKYIRSEFGVVTPKYIPAKLDNSAYLHWISKLCRPKGAHYTSAQYLRAKELLDVEFGPYTVGGISTLQDVLDDIDWDKSPGWPYVNQGCSTKREAWAMYSDEITERVDALLRGEYVECLFIATLKDELLPSGKNARVFCPAPFHHHLASAILFKKACDSITKTCHQHASAIGVNLFGRGLERLLRDLATLPYGFDADQSGCDTSWKDSEAERDFLKTGIPYEYHSGINMVFNTGMCPRVIVGDRVLQTEFNPSGQYITTLINTLGTYRMVASAYLDLHPDEDIASMRLHLKQKDGGDDLAFSTDRLSFGITELANHAAQYGTYFESDSLQPRDPMTLTFFSHNLILRQVNQNKKLIYVAAGRLSKIISAFSFIKKSNGQISWPRNAARLTGLMTNLWSYHAEFDILYPYLYHLIHHFFLLDGQRLTPEWTGIFKSIPTDQSMLVLRRGSTPESGFLFSTYQDQSSSDCIKRTLQSALKRPKMSKTDHSTRKIDDILDKLEKAHGLSEAGKEWLVSACDPFHDFDIHLAGYPDVSTDASVVQLIKKQMVIAKPAALAAGNWDCRIDLNSFMYGVQAGNAFVINSTNRVTSDTTVTGVPGMPMSGVCATAVTSGSPITPGSPGVQVDNMTCTEFLTGPSRVIGMAIEVTNTTADIYKQGSVTVYRKPNVNTLKQINYYRATPASDYNTMYISQSGHPPTLADANLYYGSRTWTAAEGCYVIGRQNGVDNPFANNNSLPGAVGYAGVFYATNPITDTQGWASSFPTPFDLSGAFFTGLSDQTTLNVTVRWILERQPLSNTPDLLVLATPSPGYDPLALEIYTRAMAQMPPGCRISENPLGEWFKKVLKGVSEWAPKIGSALSNVVPGAGILGSALGAGARLLTPSDKKPLPNSKSTTEVILTQPRPRPRLRAAGRPKTRVGGKTVRVTK